MPRAPFNTAAHLLHEKDGPRLFSAFSKVAKALDLSLSEQAALLGVSRGTMSRWKVTPSKDPDKLDRMVLVVGIYGLAGEAFSGEGGATEWLRRPNTEAFFDRKPPLDLLLKGRFEGLLRTHDHLQMLVRVW